MSLRIVSAGRGIPEKCVSNDTLSSFIDTNDEWIASRTGISSRYICTDEGLTDLAATAAQQALDAAGVAPTAVGLIICSTMEGDFKTPSLASGIAERVGTNCPVFDINAACSGFVYAMDIASLYIAHGKANYILIVCAEMMSKHLDWKDRSTCVLFGDGAAACLVTAGNALRHINLLTAADVATLNLPAGSGENPFASKRRPDGFLHMEGQEVFKFAVSTVINQFQLALTSLNLRAEQVDYFILHQANRRIIDSIQQKLGQAKEKFPTNIERYGNVSSVSIPLLLSEMLDNNMIKCGDILFMAAFGAGLAAGSCVVVWE